MQRAHATVELAIKDLIDHACAQVTPGHFAANGASLPCALIALAARRTGAVLTGERMERGLELGRRSDDSGAVGDASKPEIKVETLTLDAETLDQVAAVGTEAFSEDPFFTFLSPNRRLRRRGLRIYTKGSVGCLGERGLVLGVRGASGHLVGVAAFVRPGRYPLPARAQLRQARAAFWALLPRPPALIHGSKYLLAIDKAHPHEHLWYLQLLVVDPSVQRGGIGGALQEHVYQMADREQLASYLETQKEENLAYYRRFGYETVEELHPVRHGPPLWTLRREPRTRD